MKKILMKCLFFLNPGLPHWRSSCFSAGSILPLAQGGLTEGPTEQDSTGQATPTQRIPNGAPGALDPDTGMCRLPFPVSKQLWRPVSVCTGAAWAAQPPPPGEPWPQALQSECSLAGAAQFWAQAEWGWQRCVCSHPGLCGAGLGVLPGHCSLHTFQLFPGAPPGPGDRAALR